MWPPFLWDGERLVASQVCNAFRDPCVLPHIIKALALVDIQCLELLRHWWKSQSSCRLQFGQDPHKAKSKTVRVVPQLLAGPGVEPVLTPPYGSMLVPLAHEPEGLL